MPVNSQLENNNNNSSVDLEKEFREWERYRHKIQKERDSVVGQFRRAIKDEYKSILNNLETANRNYAFVSKELENKSPNDEGYEQLQAQLQELDRQRNGFSVRQKSLSEKLKAAGQQELAIEAENEAYQEQFNDMLQEKIDLVNYLNKVKKDLIKSGGSKEDIEDLEKQIEEAEQAKNDLQNVDIDTYKAQKTFEKKGGVKSSLDAVASTNSMPPALRSGIKAAISDERESMSGSIASGLSKEIGGPLGKVVGITGKILDVAVATRRSIDNWVDDAAKVLANNVGKINAALEGTGQTYQSVSEKMVESLGLSRFVKQTDYISQIAALTSKGITFNVEQRALLETIKEKTIASFDATNSNLLRLIRLKKQDLTASQFGLEAALRNTLNKVFKDSTYLQGIYDSVAGAITDAVMISGNKDVIEYSSVVQTWMGAMYESGIDSNMVNKLANAINALGSGNVSALASDQDIQRLILLSMDTINMDYADILQQGLSSSDINDLLTAVVKYLVKIESNTKDNNVLTSSYTQLFGMSMADLKGFKNLNSKMGQLQAVNQNSALSVTANELKLLESTQRTLVNEQISNAFDNAKFTFGQSIAKDASSYMTWKVSNLMLDVVDQIASSPVGKIPIVGSITKAVGTVAELAIFANELKGILSIAKALPSLFETKSTGLQTLINGAPKYGDSVSIGGALVESGSTFKTIQSNANYQAEYASYSGSAWESDEESSDPVLEKLDKLMTTMVYQESNAAFATFLVGMTDDTLRSFASIFADEDAMTDTFEGNNNVLKDNMFEYASGDTTSNSSKDNSSSSSSSSGK